MIPKYRAWHKQYKIMLPVLQIDLDPEHGGVFVESNDGSHCGCRLHMELWPWSDIELMQFTGLQDHTRKDIYQGDIIQIESLYSKKECVQVMWGIVPVDIIWSRAETWIVSRFHNGMKGALYPYCQPSSYSTITIIGNIWQHPHLLQSKEPQA